MMTPPPPPDLWQAFARLSAAQRDAIEAHDLDRLDALLAEKERLLGQLNAPRCLGEAALAQEAQASEEAAQTALLHAHAQLRQDLSAARQRHAARAAFLANASALPPPPRFVDHDS